MRSCRTLHNLELHNLNSLPDIIRASKRRWVGHVACMSDMGVGGSATIHTWNFD
jgi:hypothetical protein